MTDSGIGRVIANIGLCAVLAACGQPGTPHSQQPASNVSGRWGMIGWEDPVGVQLQQLAGSLTGTGCGVGTPPADRATYCSGLTGTVTGSNAKFGFDFQSEIGLGRYRADVFVSADGKRMAGKFGVEDDVGAFPMAWLPVKDGEFWVDVPTSDRSNTCIGDYELRLSSAEPGDTQYVAGVAYQLFCMGERGIGGALGAFFDSEIVRANDELLEVGPVPATSPDLPVSLSIVGKEGYFTSITARLSNGHTFTFDVTR